jgi:hypothetical protein
VEVKCKTLLYNRIQMLGAKEGSVMSELMRTWDLTGTLSNPPFATRIPSKLVYLRQYVMDMAYVAPYAPDGTRKKFKRRVYEVLLRMTNNGSPPNELRIVRKFPGVNWEFVWENLHVSGVYDTTKSPWHAAIHDIIHTKDRLAAIQLTDTSDCWMCGRTDSLQHRITECGEGPIIWNWTRKKLGIILRMDLKYIPQEWTLHPAFHHWPAQRQAAVLWILAHLVHYRLQTHRRLSLLDYMDFLKRSRWKVFHQTRKRPGTGRYLDVFDSLQP